MSTSEQVVERVVRLRRVRGMTREGLAAACAKAGFPELTGPVLANIETGRRSKAGDRRRDVTVDELFAFAQVFEVSATELLALDECSVCGGQPPAGMCCNVCGAGDVPDLASRVTRRPVRRRHVTAEFLEDVARIYRDAFAAGQPPTQAVADHFDAPHANAARWVRRAREVGTLGPSMGPRAGEAA